MKSLSYIEHLDNVFYKKKEISPDEIARLLKLIDKLPDTFSFSVPSFFVVDYVTRKYMLFTNPVDRSYGYRPGDFIEGGLDFVISIYQPDDFRTYNSHIFSQTINFLKETPQEEHNEYIFSYIFRIANKDKTLSSVFQRGGYITSRDTNLPLYSFGITMDITSFRRDTVMTQSIDRYRNTGSGIAHSNIVTNHFYPYPEEQALSRREREVLCWLGEGLSTKQIADKMFIAERTVVNHRASLMKKSNAKNVAQLIKFAVQNGII